MQNKMYAVISRRGYYGQDDLLAIEGLYNSAEEALEEAEGYGPDWDSERGCDFLGYNQSSGAVLEAWEVEDAMDPSYPGDEILDAAPIYLQDFRIGNTMGDWYRLVAKVEEEAEDAE